MNGIEGHLHIDQQWIFWLVTGGFSLLLGIVVYWVKRWIGEADAEKAQWARQGGILTRDMFFQWCSDQRAKCPACGQVNTLSEWRNGLLDDGGPMLRSEHTAICKEITKELANHFTDRIKELFDNHRLWVSQELKLISKEQEVMNKLIKEQMKTEGSRWDGHDEQTRLKK